MLRSKYSMMLVGVVLLLAGGSCTNDDLDDGGSAAVVLEVVSLDNPPVTGEAAEEGTCSLDPGTLCTSTEDCNPEVGPGLGFCETDCASFEVTDWSASLTNAPKNALAGADSIPFNDITMRTVTITYSWIDASISTPTRTVGLGNVTIPAAGTASVTFAPISFDDVRALDPAGGFTANLTLEFSAKTVEGTTIKDTVSRQLHIESCAI